MLEEIKLMLGDAASNYSDALINLCYKQSLAEVESYCNREYDLELAMVAQRITVLKLNRINTEGLSGQSFSGVSETYLDGYPADIQAILDRKRKLKLL